MPLHLQGVAEAPVVDTAFDISPLDPRQHVRHNSAQHDARRDLQHAHSYGDAEYQVILCLLWKLCCLHVQ